MGRYWQLWSALSLLALVGVAGCHKGSAANASSNNPNGVAAAPQTAQPSPPGPSVTATDSSKSSGTSLAALKVKNALMAANPPVNTSHVNVTVSQGVVRLTGSVPDAAQKAEASKAARSASGGATVVNDLTVGAGGR